MSILTTKTVKKVKDVTKEKFIGGFVPPELSNYFTLFCYANRIPKSVIIRKLLQDWKTMNIIDINQECLSNKLVAQIMETWENTEGYSFERFRINLKRELKHRQLDFDTVTQILKMVDDEYIKTKG